MRGAEKLVLLAFLLVPLFVVVLGWPAFVGLVGGGTSTAPGTSFPTATTGVQVAGISATQAPFDRTAPSPNGLLVPSTSRNSPGPASSGVVATLVPIATAMPLSTPVRLPVATPAAPPAPAQSTAAAVTVVLPSIQSTSPPPPQTTSSDPAATVLSFYQLAGSHQFAAATGLWSASMQQSYPPSINIFQRFANTAAISVRSANVVSRDDAAGTATVAVDLVESITSPAGTRHYSGTFDLVRQGARWLIDQPHLAQVP